MANGDYIHKWTYEHRLEQAKRKYDDLADAAKLDYDCGHCDRIQTLEENLEDAVSTIMDHEEKIEKLQNKLQSVIRTARH